MLVRMADPDLSEHARELNRARWGSQVVDKAAQVVISRVAELPAEIRAQVHEATGPAGGDSHGDG
jgi:hypothetical protein